MGPAHSSVVNRTNKKLCILTFNEADLLYHTYTNLYMILPGETKTVEAIPHPVGLKLCVVYHTNDDLQRVLYRRWSVKNDAIVEVLSLDEAGNVEINGVDDDEKEKSELGTIHEKSAATFAGIVQALTQESSVSLPSKQHRGSVTLSAEKQAQIASGGMGGTPPPRSQQDKGGKEGVAQKIKKQFVK